MVLRNRIMMRIQLVTGETEKESMEPHCTAQDALLKVHDRIIEEDLFGGMASDEDITVTARLLVLNNMVGCLLDKGGDVIQRLLSERDASIYVLPADCLPPCAVNTDELVQDYITEFSVNVYSNKPVLTLMETFACDLMLSAGSKPMMDFSLEDHLVNQHNGMQLLLFREVLGCLLS